MYLLVILLNIVLLTACSEDDIKKNKSVINEEDNENEKDNPNSVEDMVISYDIELLNEITNWLNGYYVKDPIVGYNSEGKVEVWAEISRDLLKSVNRNKNIITKNQYYPCFLAYNIMNKLPKVDVIWLYEYDDIDFSLTKLSRDTFNKNFETELFSDLDRFFSEEREIDKLVEYKYFNDIPEYIKLSEPLERIIKQLFTDSFVSAETSMAAGDGGFYLDIYLDSKSKQYIGDYNNQIAQTFVYSIGLYSTHYWTSIWNTNFYFINRGVTERIVGMSDLDYEDWKNNGLRLSDWCNYSFFEMPDYKELFSTSTTKTEDALKASESNMDYGEMMEQLKDKDVRVLSLGKDKTGYQAVLSYQCQTEEELYENQFSSLIDCMKLPIEKIWFVSYVGDEIYISHMTKQRYNELTFAGYKLEEYFKPSDWPIITNIYWAIE